MDKATYLRNLQDCYRVANSRDTETPIAPWLPKNAAGNQCCPIDRMIHDLWEQGVLTEEERADFYAGL